MIDKSTSYTAAQSAAVRGASTLSLPAWATRAQSSVHVSKRFCARMSDKLGVDCSIAVELLTWLNQEQPTTDTSPKVKEATIFPKLDADRYDYDELLLHLPEWTEHVTGKSVDVDELTKGLAFGVVSHDSVFPIDYPTANLSAKDPAEAIQVINQRAAQGIDWLLRKIDGDRVAVDLDTVRIQAGADVYDGHGRLLAMPLRMSSNDINSFAMTHGEEVFYRALLEGHLYKSGAAHFDGVRYTSAKAQAICGRVFGLSEDKYAFHALVAWTPEAFEAVIRPHLSDVPFSGAPGSIEGRSLPLAMLEYHLGLEPAPTASHTTGL